MTDRVHSLVVVLEADKRIDDVQPLIDAISMMRGVLIVSTDDTVANLESHMAEERARRELGQKLTNMLLNK